MKDPGSERKAALERLAKKRTGKAQRRVVDARLLALKKAGKLTPEEYNRVMGIVERPKDR